MGLQIVNWDRANIFQFQIKFLIIFFNRKSGNTKLIFLNVIAIIIIKEHDIYFEMICMHKFSNYIRNYSSENTIFSFQIYLKGNSGNRMLSSSKVFITCIASLYLLMIFIFPNLFVIAIFGI